MDVAKDQNCHNRQENEECPDEEEPEPDSSPIVHEKRTGRFIIEDFDDHRYTEDDRHLLDMEDRRNNNMFTSFRKSTLNFSSKIIEGRDLDNITPNLNDKQENSNSKSLSTAAFVFDFASNTFVNCVKFMKGKMLNSSMVYNYTYIYGQESPVVNFPDDIPDNDYAMIIQEETLENELDHDYSGNKNGNLVEIIELVRENEENGQKISHENYARDNHLYRKRKGSAADIKFGSNLPPLKSYSRNKKDSDLYDVYDKKYNSLEFNFIKRGKGFVSPKCSPITSPRELIRNDNLPNSKQKYLYSSSSHKPKNSRVKLIKDFIRSIENSFNLEDDEDEETKRKKRICSADKTYCKKFKHKREKSTFVVKARDELKPGLAKTLKFEKNEMNFMCNDAMEKNEYNHFELSIEHAISFTSKVNTTNNETFSNYSAHSICKNCQSIAKI